MHLPRALRRSSLIALALVVCLGTASPDLTAFDAVAQEQRRPNCEHFLDQEDAQVAFDADPDDPFVLDDNNDGEACEVGELFGSTPLVNCDDLRGHPGIAQALYDHSLSRYGSDRYNLVACTEQASTVADPEPLDGDPPDFGGGTIVVSTVALGTGETLEARLDAHFAALEAQFAAFEVRAANGFGRFPDSEDDATAGGQGSTVVVSTSQQPVAVAQRAIAKDDSPIVRAQKAKAGKGDRIKERKGKRDRHKGKQRNRR